MEKEREYGLDFLKFIGTIIILLHHYWQMFNIHFEKGINFYGGSFYWGNFVELFFILSGYFAYYNIEKIEGNINEFENYFKRKYLRFQPALALGCISIIVIELVSCVIYKTEFQYSLINVITSAIGITRWFNENLMVNNPVWYISVLLLCYIVFFWITWISKKLKCNSLSLYVVIVFFGIWMISVSNANNGYVAPFVNVSIGRGYVNFFWGILLNYIFRKYDIVNSIKWKIGASIWLIFFIYMYIWNNSIVNDNLYYILVFTVFPCVVMIFKSEFFHVLFSKRIFNDMGEASYDAFIFHIPFYSIISIVNNFTQINLSSVLVIISTIILTYGIGIVVAKLFHRSIVKEKEKLSI